MQNTVNDLRNKVLKSIYSKFVYSDTPEMILYFQKKSYSTYFTTKKQT